MSRTSRLMMLGLGGGTVAGGAVGGMQPGGDRLENVLRGAGTGALAGLTVGSLMSHTPAPTPAQLRWFDRGLSLIGVRAAPPAYVPKKLWVEGLRRVARESGAHIGSLAGGAVLGGVMSHLTRDREPEVDARAKALADALTRVPRKRMAAIEAAMVRPEQGPLPALLRKESALIQGPLDSLDRRTIRFFRRPNVRFMNQPASMTGKLVS